MGLHSAGAYHLSCWQPLMPSQLRLLGLALLLSLRLACSQPLPALTNVTAGDPLYVCRMHLEQRLALERFYNVTTNFSVAQAYYAQHPDWVLTVRQCVCSGISRNGGRCSSPELVLHQALNGPWCIGAAQEDGGDSLALACGCPDRSNQVSGKPWLSGPRPNCSGPLGPEVFSPANVPAHCNWWGVDCHGLITGPSLADLWLCFDW